MKKSELKKLIKEILQEDVFDHYVTVWSKDEKKFVLSQLNHRSYNLGYGSKIFKKWNDADVEEIEGDLKKHGYRQLRIED